MPEAVGTIHSWIGKRVARYVCVTSVHGIIESQFDDALKQIHNHAGLVTPDGMPLVWFMRSEGHKQADRVYGPDLMLEVINHGHDHGYRHFLYGASEESLAALQANLKRRFPKIQIVGAISPPFRALTDQESEEIANQINASEADIVWVGLSTPKQERWMAEHRAKLHAPVLVGVGAAFDFHAGRTRQAPKFLRRSGLEWLFRLITEPRRLWKRYFTIVPMFICFATMQKLGIRKYEA